MSYIIPLSSSWQARMLESNWFATSKCHLTRLNEPPIVAKNVLGNVKKKSNTAYYLQNAATSVNRLIANIAIVAFISPIGACWHARQAVKTKTKYIRLQHIRCCCLELSKLVVAISSIAGLVIAPLYPAAMKARILASEIAINLGLPCLLIGSGLFMYETYLTLFDPGSNSRQLGNFPNEACWKAKMGLKWELGLECSTADSIKILNDLLEESAKEMLSIIANLQEKLPQKHLLPIDDKINSHRILQYLEHSREDLIKSGHWQQIREPREKFTLAANRFSALQRYSQNKTFPLSAEEINGAYTAYGSLPCKPKRSSPDLQIHSLTQTLFKRMLESNRFYPSNYKLQPPVEDKGSIQLSMSEVDPFLDRCKITDRKHRYYKPVRYLARAIGSVVILGIGVPLGTIYNGAKTLSHLSAHPFLRSDLRFGNWEKVKRYALATYNDATTALSLSGIVLPFANNEKGLVSIATRADRAGLFKTITLKNSFGITGNRGKLLSYSYEEDVAQKRYYDSYFNQLCCNQSLALFYTLQKAYDQLDNEIISLPHFARLERQRRSFTFFRKMKRHFPMTQ